LLSLGGFSSGIFGGGIPCLGGLHLSIGLRTGPSPHLLSALLLSGRF
jgi:hypothetical protein